MTIFERTQKQPAVYIMTSKRNGTLYTGVTSNLTRRVYEHKNDIIVGFTKQYRCKLLVFFELYDRMEHAIAREKQIKGWLREKKLALIEGTNPGWQDLYEKINLGPSQTLAKLVSAQDDVVRRVNE